MAKTVKWNQFLSIYILFFLVLVSYVSASCTVLDHQACDELCKVDSFWYGHCTGWDGTDFSCKCFDYHAPLDGKKCQGKQRHCSRKCQEQGSEGGFCYPQRDDNRTGCECFKAIQPIRRRRHVVYRRI